MGIFDYIITFLPMALIIAVVIGVFVKAGASIRTDPMPGHFSLRTAVWC